MTRRANAAVLMLATLWMGWRDSNPQPCAEKAPARPFELQPRDVKDAGKTKNPGLEGRGSRMRWQDLLLAWHSGIPGMGIDGHIIARLFESAALRRMGATAYSGQRPSLFPRLHRQCGYQRR
jgi:hypothetical protein